MLLGNSVSVRPGLPWQASIGPSCRRVLCLIARAALFESEAVEIYVMQARFQSEYHCVPLRSESGLAKQARIDSVDIRHSGVAVCFDVSRV